MLRHSSSLCQVCTAGVLAACSALQVFFPVWSVRPRGFRKIARYDSVRRSGASSFRPYASQKPSSQVVWISAQYPKRFQFFSQVPEAGFVFPADLPLPFLIGVKGFSFQCNPCPVASCQLFPLQCPGVISGNGNILPTVCCVVCEKFRTS